jgi:hypothetical protein
VVLVRFADRGVDGTDVPTHRKQEGSAYHGYYRQHQYLPLLVFDGDTDQHISAVLRPGNAHGSHGALAVLRRLVRALPTWSPGVAIEPRADSGFAVPALYEWCEAEGGAYTIGLVPDPRPEAVAAPCLAVCITCTSAQRSPDGLLASYRPPGGGRGATRVMPTADGTVRARRSARHPCPTA